MTSDRIRLAVKAETPYEVVIGHGVTDELPGLLGSAARAAIIHPPTLRENADRLRQAMATGGELEVQVIEVPDGEAAKTADVLNHCWQVLGDTGFTRSDLVVGFGGGATTDLAGFVAASWLRGVRFVNIPTTVLGMVDAAVGGKTGINTAAGKNLVGAFHEPTAVLCDLSMLQALAPAEVRSGMAEVVKCGFISDPSILDAVEGSPDEALDPTSSLMAELIAKGIAVKVKTVESDLREAGGTHDIGREALNYGHTLGHALERVQAYGLRHGEAISVGMVFAAELAYRAGHIDLALLRRHRDVLTLVGLPTTTAEEFPPLLDAMRMDKKTRGRTLRFVVLDGLARPAILEGPDDEVLRGAFAAVSA